MARLLRPAVRLCTTTASPAATAATARPPREPLLSLIANTLSPWRELARVLAPREMHARLVNYANTTVVVGTLLVGAGTAGLVSGAPRPATQREAAERAGSGGGAMVMPALVSTLDALSPAELLASIQRAVAASPSPETVPPPPPPPTAAPSKFAEDAYYSLMTLGTYGAFQITLLSTLVLTCASTIPTAATNAFVARHALFIATPAILIGPSSIAIGAGLCVALEAHFDSPLVSSLAWGGLGATIVFLSFGTFSLLLTSHALRRAALLAAERTAPVKAAAAGA